VDDGETPDAPVRGQTVDALRQKLEGAYGSTDPVNAAGSPPAVQNRGNLSVKEWRKAQSQSPPATVRPSDPPPLSTPSVEKHVNADQRPTPKRQTVKDPLDSVFAQADQEAIDPASEKLFTQLRTPPAGDDARASTDAPKLPAAIYIGSLFINMLALALPIVILQVYDRVLPNQATATLSLLIVGLIGVLILDTAMKVARAYIVGWATANHEYAVSIEAVSRILHAPSSQIEAEPPTVHIDRLNAFDAMRNFYGGQSRLLMLDLPFVFLFLALVGFIGGYLMFVPIVLFVIIGSASIAGGSALRSVLQTRARHDDRRYDFIIESLAGVQTIKTMAMEPQIQRRFERLQKLGAATSYQTILLGNSAQIFSNLFSSLTMISVVTLGAYMVIQGGLTMGSLAACTLLSGRTIQPVLKGLDLWIQIQALSVARARIVKLFELDPATGELGQAIENLQGAISIRDVSFTYGPDTPLVLKNVNLEVAPGEMIGLRGGDGSGKTTLIRLIRGQFAPTTGEVKLDGYQPAGIQHASMAEWLSYVPQKATVFQGTILENITMFRTGEVIDAAREAARLIGLEADIHHLPSGYDTMLGEGITEELPGDMMQRIVIARALSKKPRILLFDEGNSSLDTRSDALLKKGLEQISGRTTIILVSLRPSLLRMAERVYALQDGQLFDVTAEYAVPAMPAQDVVPEAS